VITKCQAITDWANADLHKLIAGVVEELEVGFGKVGYASAFSPFRSSTRPCERYNHAGVGGQGESINRLELALVHLVGKFG